MDYGKASKKKKLVDSRLRVVGPFILGPKLEVLTLNKNIMQCLARKVDSDTFYTIKMAAAVDSKLSEKEREARILLHNEYSLLSLLQYVDGVVHHHGFFKDDVLVVPEDRADDSASTEAAQSPVQCPTSAAISSTNSAVATRFGLVLDCLVPHEFSPASKNFANLQHHVIKERRLPEREAVAIFLGIARVVAELHKRNIIHRDLKLGNVVLNKATRSVTLTNFSLAKHLVRESDPLRDQRCGLAYISPEVIIGRPYLGKPCDMWALGVLFYSMLFGKFPFFDSGPQEMTRKIMAASFDIPQDGYVSHGSLAVIKRLLVLDPTERMTAAQVVAAMQRIVTGWCSLLPVSALQVVPTGDNQSVTEREHNSSATSQSVTTLTGVGQLSASQTCVTLSCASQTNVNHLSEFERRLMDVNSRAALNLTVRSSQQSLSSAPLSKVVGPPIVRRTNQDARPLTAAELLAHRRLLGARADGM